MAAAALLCVACRPLLSSLLLLLSSSPPPPKRKRRTAGAPLADMNGTAQRTCCVASLAELRRRAVQSNGDKGGYAVRLEGGRGDGQACARSRACCRVCGRNPRAEGEGEGEGGARSVQARRSTRDGRRAAVCLWGGGEEGGGGALDGRCRLYSPSTTSAERIVDEGKNCTRLAVEAWQAPLAQDREREQRGGRRGPDLALSTHTDTRDDG